MRAWPGQTATPTPKTYAGRWLRAALLSQLQRGEQLRGALNGGDAAGLKYRYSIGKRLETSCSA